MTICRSCLNVATCRNFRLAAIATLLMSATGCGHSGDQPELGLVSGTVTIDGAALAGVTVTFVPDNGRPAMGHTDANGKYQLTYIRDERGCKLGRNRVQIGNREESDDADQLEGDDYIQKPTRPPPPKVPPRYNSRSELVADVESGENRFDFRLRSRK